MPGTADTSSPIWERLPNAPIDQDNRAFYEGWPVHELRVQKCADCSKWHMPPRTICPFCWSFNVVPTAVSGRGRVYLFIILSQGIESPGVTYPYPVVTIELEEQPALRFTSTMVDCALSDIKIDMPVELAWIDRSGVPFPAFRPRRGA